MLPCPLQRGVEIIRRKLIAVQVAIEVRTGIVRDPSPLIIILEIMLAERHEVGQIRCAMNQVFPID